jgi:hypothetical protein
MAGAHLWKVKRPPQAYATGVAISVAVSYLPISQFLRALLQVHGRASFKLGNGLWSVLAS